MTDSSSGNDVLAHLREILSARDVDSSYSRFTWDEWRAMFAGKPIPRLEVLDEIAEDFVVGASRLALPERASHLEEQARILDLWGSTLDALDALRLLSASLGVACDERAADASEQHPDRPSPALAQLFWGAHVIASEVITLLRHGHAAGAVARWRALYEMGVQAAVIAEGGAEIGRRFIEHERMRHYSEGRRWWTEVDPAELTDEDRKIRGDLDAKKRALVDRYGEWFTRE
ncbi:MAG: DUF5677 domain-containing protein [Solirubrobacteraceae bacterium]